MARHSFVEMDSGDQEYFPNPYEAFKFAKMLEEQRKDSVEAVVIGGEYSTATDDELLLSMDELTVYRGQKLRHMIRSIDNVTQWVRAQVEEEIHAREVSDSD